MRKSFPIFLIVGLLIASAGFAINQFIQQSDYWNDPVEQWALIKFSHKLHVTENGMECSDCHASADTSLISSDFLLPTKATCADCHEVDDEMQCSMCHADANRQEKFQKPPMRELIFNHQKHVEQKIECTQCHAGIENSEAPSLASMPTMTSCNTCHDGLQATNTCENCHSQATTLLPASHKQIDWVKEHKRQVRVDAMSNDCSVCHSDNDCAACHAEVGVQQTKGEFLRPLPEFRPSLLGKNLQVKQNVHSLNYRFTHSFDFRAKRSDCYSCHDQQSFCNDCHTKNQDAGFSSPIPATHRQQGFIRLGVGSGGGWHAFNARKDIESCAACHDVEGRDPACLTCHVDRTPGKGNDPKTHKVNFLMSDKGDWHSNPGSTCFNCHVNTQSAGIGFCGYCHGAK